MGKIFPNTFVAGIDIGGLSSQQALALISNTINNGQQINLLSNGQIITIKSNDIDLIYDHGSTIARAFNLTRTGNIFVDNQNRIMQLFKPVRLGLYYKYDSSKLNSTIYSIDKRLSIAPVYPSIQIVNSAIEINPGNAGVTVDDNLLKLMIGQKFALLTSDYLQIPKKVVDPTINPQQQQQLKERAGKYLGKTLTLKYSAKTYVFNDNELLKFLDPNSSYNDSHIQESEFKIAQDINTDPQNPKFVFSGNKVTEFSPATPGITLDNDKFKFGLISALNELAARDDGEITFDIPVIKKDPELKTEDGNDLGIKELIGTGHSTYFHSIPGRVFNVNLAASRVNGTLVAPGETFSFDQTIGDVSKYTGYQQAYIIQNGRTILGDGGGVCQVSTTLFRAVLNAGLPVVERNAHAYRVGYYEQNSSPGIDATIYYPTVDFKFTNDTANYILIEAKNDPKNFSLTFEIYGTKDGRVAKTTKPVISNYSPPLPDVYQDDPTLPIGTVKQTDYAAAGARVSFNYSVTKDGSEMFNKTFISNYQPWAAVYLRGTKTN